MWVAASPKGDPLILTPTEIPDVLRVELEPHADERGFFARAWDEDEFASAGAAARFVQTNIVHSRRAGTIRGLHWQEPPYAEVKLVRCTRGAVWDVAVDVRPESSTFRHWVAVELTADNRVALYVPEGFAHGYQTLVDDTETTYAVSARYAPQAERGLRWDDPALAIGWPDATDPIVSEKDQAWPLARSG